MSAAAHEDFHVTVSVEEHGSDLAYRSSGGIKFHTPIASEYHPRADTPGHTTVHNGDCHTYTRIFAGNVNPNTEPRAGDRCTDSRQGWRPLLR